MRLLLVMLVTAQLLLRGVAVPHAHEAHAEAPGHSHRQHVHLSGHGHHHGHERGHRNAGDGAHGHHHHAQTIAQPVPGAPADEPAPDHDRDAVYLDDDGLILLTAERVSPTQAAADWLMVPACGAERPLAGYGSQPRRVRPPGDAAASIHALLPHVLRI